MRLFVELSVLTPFVALLHVTLQAQTPPPLLARPSPTPRKIVDLAEQTAAMASFKKQLYDRINSQWLTRVKAQEPKLRAGTVRVRFTLTNAGEIRGVRILSNNSDERLKRLIVDAIKHTEIPAPPLLTYQNEVDIDLTFRLVQN
jgi:TonB family protein